MAERTGDTLSTEPPSPPTNPINSHSHSRCNHFLESSMHSIKMPSSAPANIQNWQLTDGSVPCQGKPSPGHGRLSTPLPFNPRVQLSIIQCSFPCKTGAKCVSSRRSFPDGFWRNVTRLSWAGSPFNWDELMTGLPSCLIKISSKYTMRNICTFYFSGSSDRDPKDPDSAWTLNYKVS